MGEAFAMQTFLTVVGGIVVGFVILGALALFWLRKKIGGVCESLIKLVVASGIPPFRIHLEAGDEIEWNDAEGVEAASARFAAASYGQIGSFTIREMESLRIRAFWHAREGFFAVLYDHDEAGVFADVFRDFADGTAITVSVAPETGMDRPRHAPLFRIEADVREEGTVQAMHDRLVHEAIGLERYEHTPEEFPHLFSEFYAQEMDWRIARGGVTRGEIERVAEITGEAPPSDAQVEMIQEMWQGAISEFIESEVQKIWLADSGLSAIDWERLRDRIMVVHEYGDPQETMDAIAWRMAEAGADPSDDEAISASHEAALERLRPLFESGATRDGFRQAQAMLSEKQRFERLGSVDDPWPADVWAGPEDDDF